MNYEMIPVGDVPLNPIRRRNGKHLAVIKALKPGMAIRVECNGESGAQSTLVLGLLCAARRLGVKTSSTRSNDGDCVHIWLVDENRVPLTLSKESNQ